MKSLKSMKIEENKNECLEITSELCDPEELNIDDINQQ